MDGMNENRMPKLFVCIVQRGKTQDTCCQKRQKNLATSWIKNSILLVSKNAIKLVTTRIT